MKKEVELCDFCDNSQELHLAKSKCLICGKHLCYAPNSFSNNCSGIEKKHFPSVLTSFLPVICKECFEIIKYKTVVDRTWSDDIKKEFDKLLLQQTEPLRAEIKKIVDDVFKKLYRAGKRNLQKDEQIRKKQNEEKYEEEREKVNYIPF